MTSNFPHLAKCTSPGGGGLYMKDGDVHHLGGNVTMLNSIAGVYGGGVYLSSGKYYLAGAVQLAIPGGTRMMGMRWDE